MGEIRLVCTGYATEAGRVPIAELREPFDHDMSKHRDELVDVSPRHADGDWFDDDELEPPTPIRAGRRK